MRCCGPVSRVPVDRFEPFKLAQGGKPIQIVDIETLPDSQIKQIARARGFRAMLFAPLMSNGVPIGLISVTRLEAGSFIDHHVQLLQTFADQAVIAIENARLFEQVRARTRELSEALQQQTATADVLKVINRSAFDLNIVLDTLVSSAARLCGADSGVIFQREGGLYRFGANYGFPAEFAEYARAHPIQIDRTTMTGRVALEGKTIQITDVQSDPDYTTGYRLLGDYRTVLGVPLLREGRPIGSFSLTRSIVQPFTVKQVELVETFADQAVIAIENARLFEQVQARTRDLTEALQQQTATADVLKVISRAAFDLQAVLDALLSSACRLCGADIGTIRYEDADSYRLAATFGCKPEWIEHFRTYTTQADRSSIFGRTILAGRPVHVPDVLADADYRRPAAQELMRFRAALGVPLVREGHTFGVINLFRFAAGSFEEKQIELVATFADQAVIAIENVRLFEQVQARTRDLAEALQQQTATADVLKVISRSAFDLQTVLDTLTELAAKLCNADMAAMTRQDETGGFRHMTNYNFSVDWIRIADAFRLHPGRGSLVGRVLLARKAVQIADVLADPDYGYPEMQQAAGYRALLGVPLLRSGEPIGVLFLARKVVEPFTDKQVELVSTFADQAVIAIENVRLFEEVQARTRDLTEALTYQTGSANILKVIASSPTDVEPVLRTIVESACELCEAYDAVLVLKEGQDLVVRAHHGPIEMGTQTWAHDRTSVSGRAIADKATIHLYDVLSDQGMEFPIAQTMSRQDGCRTILAVPMLSEGECIGAIVLRRAEVQPFSDKQVNLLQTFADQAVIALGNVRLFEQVQARTRDLTEALQQQTATSEVLEIISASAGELAPVFDKMLENATHICGARFGTMTLYENGGFRLVALYNAPPAYFDTQLYKLIRPHPESGLSIVERTHQTVHIDDVRRQSPYLQGHPNVRALADLAGARTLVIVPMLKDDELIGSITIFRQEVKPFTDKQIELVTSFANQAVIAIENARLLNELRKRTTELSQSLDELRTAQDRLVQTEKLASLGQLTAGIAHEIKNPLNFVNNFSTLSAELIEELGELLGPAALDDKTRADVDELAQMLKGNLDKVVQHGKRADSIVRNMLLHSREGSGERRPADINAIVEESLNLAYHGARAEKSDFNITLERDLDPNAGTAELYPQEITRVFLNLISNGFYAAHKRKETAGDSFEPTVSATTNARAHEIEIRIRDNGMGIPEDVRAKIFNPFFTTKPAGEGTGLGLSMSHDIIVKQHGGTIDVHTQLGAFTEFIITLPRTWAAQGNIGGGT